MGGGMVGGLIAAAIGDPVLAMSTVIPVMGLGAIVSYVVWRRIPEPALARVVITGTGDGA
jgi:DHA1 family bicyclomycin/chloramphenicol resistance-like MFS transporter